MCMVQDTEDCQDDRTECRKLGTSSTPPRDVLFRVCLAMLGLLSHYRKTSDNIRVVFHSVRASVPWSCWSRGHFFPISSARGSCASRVRVRHDTRCREHVGCEKSSDASTRHDPVKIPQDVHNLLGAAWQHRATAPSHVFKLNVSSSRTSATSESREQFARLLRGNRSLSYDVS